MVEIIPKGPRKPSIGLNVLFYFAISLLIFSIIGYFALNSFLEKAKEEKTALESALTEAMSPDKIALGKEILAAKDKIDNFSHLIEQHLATSRIFEIIQRTTHPQAWFTKFDFNSQQGTLKIFGETQSFETLGQQILILRGEAAIDRVNLEKISIAKEGKVDFELFLSFSPAQ